MKKIISLFLFLLLASVFGLYNLSADGDAAQRQPTAAEKAYFKKVLGAIDKALPAPPKNWTADTKPLIEGPKTVNVNCEKGDALYFNAIYKGRWENRGGTNDDSGGQSAQELAQEMMRASQSGDKAAYKRASEKMMALGKKNVDTANAKRKAIDSIDPKDKALEVEIQVNAHDASLRRAEPLKLAGNLRAFITDGSYTGKGDETRVRGVVLLGTWDNGETRSEYTYYKSNWRSGIPHPSSKNMCVEVTGAEKRVREYLQGINWSALNAQLVK
ncbi:MAG: hypothetical protein KA369_15450 [Spirochaetes bacterium]|nr:hypothetical protein [Spirochaetota bacterium]